MKILEESVQVSRSSIPYFEGIIEALNVTMHYWLKRGVIVQTHELFESLDMLESLNDSFAKKMLQNETNRSNKAEDFKNDNLEPPNDFRQFPIHPLIEELQSHYYPFLRRIKKAGAYRDAEQFLDVHYRLMRDDLIRPLREGIIDFSANIKTSLNVYNCIRFIESTPNRFTMDWIIEFKRLDRVRWEISKKLLPGSLLCLSNNNFRTMCIATVSKRDISSLKRGLVAITLQEEFEIDFNVNYTMVESEAFFEPYKHVLKGLQEMNSQNIPFKENIINCEKEVDVPRYVLRRTFWNVKEIFPTNIDEIKILDPTKWPLSTQLSLDPSQLRAIQLALTKKLAIIQGPPGTGKTFVGLKIAHILLKNKILWKKGPMMIVAYTNHALDQFLEGIIQFENNVIRLGGGCKSEKLKKYTLSAVRKVAKQQRRKRRSPNLKEIAKVRGEMAKVLVDIKNCQTTLNEKSNRLLGPLSMMISREEESILKNSKYSYDNKFFYKWLFPKYESAFQATNAVPGVSQDNNSENETYDSDSSSNDGEAINPEIEKREMDENSRTSKKVKELLSNNSKDMNQSFLIQKNILDESGFLIKVNERAMKKEIKKRLNSFDTANISDFKHKNIDIIDIDIKWKIYRFFLHRLNRITQTTLSELNNQYKNLGLRLKDLYDVEDLDTIRNASVIAMTTTMASKLRHILKKLACPIVIFEEAAEVFESHILTSLSPHCQHLILIGDHLQLKPKPVVHDLAVRYNLEVSMFERLIENGLPHVTLGVQRRMRPEVSNLIMDIYPNLKDHQSTLNREQIKGVSKDVFCFNHSEMEDSSAEDGHSKKNSFEAEMVVGLVRYLRQQDYRGEQITIITPYMGQVVLIRKYMKKNNSLEKIFQNIRVVAIDNYQGEENDIIILSLVRSNNRAITGFVTIENRICVMLSRAKLGLYIFGNIDLFTQKSLLWKKIVERLEVKNQIGKSLHLSCRRHKNGISIKNPSDFASVKRRGCGKLCGESLPCGHLCDDICHDTDPCHQSKKCKMPCIKFCSANHLCKKLCHQKCGPCQEIVTKTLNICGHKVKTFCYQDILSLKCKEDCKKVLPCGHRCAKKCSEICLCSMPCMTKLECGHMCTGYCSDCGNHKFHKRCRYPIKKSLACSHKIEYYCSDQVPECCSQTSFPTLTSIHQLKILKATVDQLVRFQFTPYEEVSLFLSDMKSTLNEMKENLIALNPITKSNFEYLIFVMKDIEVIVCSDTVLKNTSRELLFLFKNLRNCLQNISLQQRYDIELQLLRIIAIFMIEKRKKALEKNNYGKVSMLIEFLLKHLQIFEQAGKNDLIKGLVTISKYLREDLILELKVYKSVAFIKS